MPRTTPAQDRLDFIAELVADAHDLDDATLNRDFGLRTAEVAKLIVRDSEAFENWARNQNGPMDAEDAHTSCRARAALDTARCELEALSTVIEHRKPAKCVGFQIRITGKQSPETTNYLIENLGWPSAVDESGEKIVATYHWAFGLGPIPNLCDCGLTKSAEIEAVWA